MTTPQETAAVRRLARTLQGLQRDVRTLQYAPRLGYSSFEGSITQYEADGQTLATTLGVQVDGSNGVVAFTGPTPPAPSTPVVQGAPGGLLIRWDGDFTGGPFPVAVAPLDFARVEVHVSTESGFLPSRLTLATSFTSPLGEEAFLSLPAVEHHVRLVTRTIPGKPSDTTAQVSATPLPFVDVAEIEDQLTGVARIRVSLDPPSDPGEHDGALWWQVDENGAVIGQWAWDTETGAWQVRSLSGSVIAANTIATEALAANAITAEKIAAGAITARELAALAVTADKIAANSVDATKITAGAVTADKLTSILVLATDIVAGDPLGTHVRLQPDGVHIFAIDPTDNSAQEVIRLGTSGSDFFGVASSDGTLVASISQSGYGSFAALTSHGDVTVAGRPLLGPALPRLMASVNAPAWLDAFPRGLVPGGWGQIVEYSPRTDNTPGIGVFEIDVTLQGGRQYRVQSSSLRLTADAPDTLAESRVVYKRTQSALTASPATPAAPVVGDPILARDIRAVTDPTGEGLHIDGIFTPPGDAATLHRYRLLLTVLRPLGVGRRPSGGWVQLAASTNDPAQLWVEDVGLAVPNAGQVNSGGGVTTTPTPEVPAPPPPPAAPPTRNYVEEFGYTFMQSYRSNNLPYDNDAGQAYQGYGGSSYVGTARSLIGFDSAVQSRLSGATIHSIEVYLHFTHWWYNAGGTAMIGLHGHTSQPGSYSSLNEQIVASGGWPKPGARWLALPVATYSGFASGLYRGITLRAPGDSTNREYYGIANDARLRINYTK